MKKTEATKLIKKGETKTVEYKESLTNSEIRRSMVAFANAEGGTIFIGVRENKDKKGKEGIQYGEIIGLEENRDRDRDKGNIKEWANKEIFPSIDVDCYDFNIKGRLVYAIKVGESKNKPVCTKDGRYLIRGINGTDTIFQEKMRNIIFDVKYEIESLKDEFEYYLDEVDDLEKKYKLNPKLAFISLKDISIINLNLFLSKSYLKKYLNFDDLKSIRKKLVIINFSLDQLNTLIPLEKIYKSTGGNYDYEIKETKKILLATISLLETSVKKMLKKIEKINKKL